jgi:hypothetical protein
MCNFIKKGIYVFRMENIKYKIFIKKHKLNPKEYTFLDYKTKKPY